METYRENYRFGRFSTAKTNFGRRRMHSTINSFFGDDYSSQQLLQIQTVIDAL